MPPGEKLRHRRLRDRYRQSQKTSDGGYAIDPTDLFRVFE